MGEVTPIKKKKAAARPPLDPMVWTNEPWESKLMFTGDGRPKKTTANMLLVFESHPAWRESLRYNERWKRVVWSAAPPIEGAEEGASLTQHNIGQAVKWVQGTYEIDMGVKTLGEIMVLAAQNNRFDPVRDWLDTLEWDGLPRLDHMLSDCIGCDYTPYTAAIGAKFLISAVARTYRPGCKVDTMLILIGKQGIGKSRLLRSMVPNERWFLDDLPSIDSKDAKQALHGPLLIEMSELDAMRKAEATATKKFLSLPADDFRAPYAPLNEWHPRRCVFSGSTNQRAPLQDPSGGRRFWPIEALHIDQGCLDENRDNYWSEAVARFRAGEEWWLTGEAEALSIEQQEERMTQDSLEEVVFGWLDRNQTTTAIEVPPCFDQQTRKRIYTTPAEILTGLEQPIAIGSAHGATMRIAEMLQKEANGPWIKGRITVGNRRPWVYFVPKKKGE